VEQGVKLSEEGRVLREGLAVRLLDSKPESSQLLFVQRLTKRTQ